MRSVSFPAIGGIEFLEDGTPVPSESYLREKNLVMLAINRTWLEQEEIEFLRENFAKTEIYQERSPESIHNDKINGNIDEEIIYLNIRLFFKENSDDAELIKITYPPEFILLVGRQDVIKNFASLMDNEELEQYYCQIGLWDFLEFHLLKVHPIGKSSLFFR